MAMKPQGTVSRDIGPLSLRAEIERGSVDGEARTVELVWTTGAQVLRQPWFDEPYMEELSLDPKHVRMDRLRNGAPLLNSHNSYDLADVIGVVADARLEKGKGTATVRFPKAADDPTADAIFRKVQDGIIRNVSVGYRVHKMEQVQGGDAAVRVMRATDWEPYEISMVPMGADAGAGVRSRGAPTTNRCEIVLQERSMANVIVPKTRTAESSDSEKEPEEAADGAEKAAEGDGEDASGKDAAPAPSAPEDGEAGRSAADLAVRKDRKRAVDMRRIGKTLKLDESFVERHINSGTSLDKFRAEALDMHETRTIETGSGPRIEAGADARDKWVRGVTSWLLVRAALEGAVNEAAKKRGETPVRLEPGEFRGMSFVELARQSLERGGVRTAGWDKMRILGEALTQRGSGYLATGDFSTALENAMHKSLLAAYAVTPDTWTRFCAIGSVADFRAHNRYRMGTFGSLPTVLEGGEYTNLNLADAKKESITAATKGAMVGISRQALINDDLGVFNQMAAMVGRSAKLTIEKDVFALLALNTSTGPTMDSDSTVLFHTDHANISTGAALSAAAIDADRVKMAQQMDPSSNEYLDLRPKILLVPVGLGGVARLINTSQYDPDTLANKSQMKPNVVAGLFADVVDTPRLSGTRRYLFADPSVAPVIEVAFLEGQQEPSLEVKDTWRSDGVEWKVRLDYAVDAIDWRGAIMNAGV